MFRNPPVATRSRDDFENVILVMPDNCWKWKNTNTDLTSEESLGYQEWQKKNNTSSSSSSSALEEIERLIVERQKEIASNEDAISRLSPSQTTEKATLESSKTAKKTEITALEDLKRKITASVSASSSPAATNSKLCELKDQYDKQVMVPLLGMSDGVMIGRFLNLQPIQNIMKEFAIVNHRSAYEKIRENVLYDTIRPYWKFGDEKSITAEYAKKGAFNFTGPNITPNILQTEPYLFKVTIKSDELKRYNDINELKNYVAILEYDETKASSPYYTPLPGTDAGSTTDLATVSPAVEISLVIDVTGYWPLHYITDRNDQKECLTELKRKVKDGAYACKNPCFVWYRKSSSNPSNKSIIMIGQMEQFTQEDVIDFFVKLGWPHT